MKLRTAALLVVALLVAFPMLATAHPCKAPVDKCATKCNPDGRTSITLTAGLGALDGLTSDGEADLSSYGLSLVHPATKDWSLLAGYNHTDADWDSSPIFTPFDLDVDMFTIGVRFYLGD